MNLVGPLKYEQPPHLPPKSAAPILEYYDLESKRVVEEYQLDAPVDDRGVVDIFNTVKLALSLVDDDHIWPRDTPDPDVHHFVWKRDWYHPRHFGGSMIPRDYRDKIPFHKGYMPRQFHDFLHTVFRPPAVPDFSVMEARVRDYEIAAALFESAKGAVTAQRRPHKISGVPVSPETGEVLLDEEILMHIMANFQRYFENSKQSYDESNQFIIGSDILHQPADIVARHLGRIAGLGSINCMPMVYANRKKPVAA